MPIAINIEYDVNIIARYQEDLNMILSNWIVFFNPSIYVVMKNPREPGKWLKCQCLWNGSVTTDLKEEITSSDPNNYSA